MEHDVGEERVGLERHDWMWNPMKRVAGDGFNFVVRADRKRKGIEPGTHEVSWRSSKVEIVNTIA